MNESVVKHLSNSSFLCVSSLAFMLISIFLANLPSLLPSIVQSFHIWFLSAFFLFYLPFISPTSLHSFLPSFLLTCLVAFLPFFPLSMIPPFHSSIRPSIRMSSIHSFLLQSCIARLTSVSAFPSASIDPVTSKSLPLLWKVILLSLTRWLLPCKSTTVQSSHHRTSQIIRWFSVYTWTLAEVPGHDSCNVLDQYRTCLCHTKQRHQSGLKCEGRGSGSKKDRFFQANFRKISIFSGNFKNIRFIFLAKITHLQLLLVKLFYCISLQTHHFRTYFLYVYMIRHNNISRSPSRPPATPMTPAQTLGSRPPNFPRIDAPDTKQGVPKGIRDVFAWDRRRKPSPTTRGNFHYFRTATELMAFVHVFYTDPYNIHADFISPWLTLNLSRVK